MKVVLLLALALLSAHSQAGCKVFIPDPVFYHDSGYSINFDFYSLLKDKGYEEVNERSSADHVLQMEGVEVEGRLHKAEGNLSMGSLRVSHRTTCFTQFCGISDYARSFQKTYREFSKKLPHCL